MVHSEKRAHFWLSFQIKLHPTNSSRHRPGCQMASRQAQPRLIAQVQPGRFHLRSHSSCPFCNERRWYMVSSTSKPIFGQSETKDTYEKTGHGEAVNTPICDTKMGLPSDHLEGLLLARASLRVSVLKDANPRAFPGTACVPACSAMSNTWAYEF